MTDDDTDTTPEAFALRLPPGPARASTVTRLAAWVEDLLIPAYLGTPTPSRRWCARWWDHAEAIGRLHALYLAWLQLTAPDAGLTGPSVWHREHLDPALAALVHPTGPFAACSADPARPAHHTSEPVLILPPPQVAL